MKKSILIGSLSGQNFAIETTKMDCTRGSFAVLFHLKHCREKSHLFRGTVRKPVFPVYNLGTRDKTRTRLPRIDMASKL